MSHTFVEDALLSFSRSFCRCIMHGKFFELIHTRCNLHEKEVSNATFQSVMVILKKEGDAAVYIKVA